MKQMKKEQSAICIRFAYDKWMIFLFDTFENYDWNGGAPWPDKPLLWPQWII